MQVEKLLAAEPEGVEEEGPDALSARCRQLERIAGEVSRLKFFAARGQVAPPHKCSTPFVSTFLPNKMVNTFAVHPGFWGLSSRPKMCRLFQDVRNLLVDR